MLGSLLLGPSGTDAVCRDPTLFAFVLSDRAIPTSRDGPPHKSSGA
jgi:hypothetical protein